MIEEAEGLLKKYAEKPISNDEIERRRAEYDPTLTDPDLKVFTEDDPTGIDLDKFEGEEHSGVDEEALEQITADPTMIDESADPTAVDEADVNVDRKGSRLLQSGGTYTIYNTIKTLFHKTILGKTFKVQLRVKCYLITSASPDLVSCKAYLIRNFFGKVKTYTIASFSKPITINWSQSFNWSGSVGVNFYIPLPPPVSFIGINLYFSVGIKVSIHNYANGQPQIWVYTFKAGTNAEV